MPTVPRSLLLAIAAALALPAAAPAANTITVNPGDNVQAKFDSAADGDTVHFTKGTYQTTVSTAKNNLTVTGEQGVILIAPTSATAATLAFTGTDAKLLDMTVISSVGDAVVLGKGTTLVQRSTLITTKSAANALTVTGASADAARAITLDSTVLSGPVALNADYASATVAGAGITVSARHVTAIGAIHAVASNGSLVAGNIAVTFLDSIIRGTRTTVNGTPATATITADPARNSVADNANDASALFIGPARFNYHLRADASSLIDKGQVTSGESETDVDGDARTTGSASDYGADEFVNKAPTAQLAGPAGKVRQGIAATFDASKSSDPEAATGGGIASYHWDFGDGTTADTATPTTTHTFADRKSYAVKVTVTDKQGGGSAPSSPVTVDVLDGTPPTVGVAQPRSHQKLQLYKPKANGAKGKRARVTLFGKSTDDTLLAKVYLALRPLKLAGTKCRWFDGKRKLVTGECRNPIVLSAKLTGTSWRYTLPLRAKLPTGAYQLVALAVDASGLPSAIKTVNFRFR